MTKAVSTHSDADHGSANKEVRGRAGPPSSYFLRAPVFDGRMIQRTAACACGGGCPRCARSKSTAPNQPAPRVAELVREAETSPGAPLPSDLQMWFSSGLGVDLSGVRLHTGEQSMRAAE